jgi:hypothetical protein
MPVKADQSKVRKRLIMIPALFAVFFICIAAFLAWVGFQLAFISSKNNFTGYIVFCGLLAGFVWYFKVACEHYKLLKMLPNSTIDFGNKFFVFTNPHGKIELPYDQLKLIELHNRSDFVQFYGLDSLKVNAPEGIKKFLPGKLLFHEKPCLILRDIYEQEVTDIVSTIPELKEKLKHYDDLAWSRAVGS